MSLSYLAKKLESDKINDYLIKLCGSKCGLCFKSYPDGKAWIIHHRKYKKGEKKSSDFKERIPHTITRGKRKGKKTKKTIYHKLEYLTYVKPIVEKEPHRFTPLHNSCHQAVTRLARWKKDNLDRLYILAKEQKEIIL